MTTSFRRTSDKNDVKSANTSIFEGVKLWPNSQYITSSGLRKLDEIFGGGVILGSFVLIEEDEHFSQHSATLLSYAIAESISSGSTTLLITSDSYEADKILENLPKNLNFRSKTSTEVSNSEPSVSCKPNDLKIAWQYQKYLQPETNPLMCGNNSNSSNSSNSSKSETTNETNPKLSYCCSYDLSERLQIDLIQKNPPHIIFSKDKDLTSLIHDIQIFLSVYSKFPKAIRIFMPHLGGVGKFSPVEQNKLIKSFLYLKQTMNAVKGRSAQAVLYATLSKVTKVKRTLVPLVADYAVSLESTVGKLDFFPAEFRDFLGFLRVKKVDQNGYLSSHRPTYIRYGLKRDSRKLHIEPLHLPPHEEEKGRGEISNENNKKATITYTNSIQQTKDSEKESYLNKNVDKSEIKIEEITNDLNSSFIGKKRDGQVFSIKPVNISSFKSHTGGNPSKLDSHSRKIDISALKSRSSQQGLSACNSSPGYDKFDF